MNFKLYKSDLLSALKNVSKAISTKSQIKALEGVLFTLSQGEMKLTGYDLEQGIETVISAESFDTGKFIVDSKLFTSIISKMPKEEINFSIADNVMTINSGKTTVTLPIMNAEDYPSLPDVESCAKIVIDCQILKNMIQQTIYAVATNDTKPILTGELFEIENGQLNIVAIDGYRMAIATETITADDTKIVIPSKCLSNVASVLNTGVCELYLSKKHAKFVVGDYSVFTRLLEGEFHNYKSSLPNSHTTEVVANTRELIDSLERCQLLINDRIKSPIRCNFKDGQINISLNTSLGKINDTAMAEIIGDTVEIGFNVKYLLDALKVVESDKVHMYLTSSVKPMTIKEDGYTALVLPVKLKND